jgi:hypothetical protein
MTEQKDDKVVDPAAPYGRRKDGTPKKAPGRPRGLPNQAVFRGKLTSKYIREMKRNFDKHGEKAIEAVAINHPDKFLQLMSQLVPKQAEIKTEDVTEDKALSTVELANKLAGIIARAGEEATRDTGGGELQDLGALTGASDGSLPH